jgi:tetratricopeptide (TPR) repeat protein
MMTEHDLPTFGTQLKHFRTEKHLTQQQLAQELGVHRNAISRWEQGDVLPASKAMVLELARVLSLGDQETRQFLEASLTALAPYWLVPLPRNPFFTGREETLQALHAQLGINQAVALTQSSALHGLGGIGKTQIALEYAYRYALEYSAVFWIGAETEEQIIASFLRIAETLQLPGREDKDQRRVVAAVQRWLSAHVQWLLIWDNVEELELLHRFLPPTRQGVVLITTRCQILGTIAQGLDLLPMEHEEAMLFLLRRAKVLEPGATREQMQQFAARMPEAYTAASEVVTALGSLPLALDQAGAYIEETRCGLRAYLDLFRARWTALLAFRGQGSRHHPESVSTTFTLAITATAQHHPAPLDLLRACALLQPDAIPEELFRQGAEHLGACLEAACRDPLEWNSTVGVACSYSLLSRQPEEQTLSIHRLVQAVLLDEMTDEEQEQWRKRVIAALDALFPEVLNMTEYAAWKQCERLLPHTLLCLHQAGAGERSFALASLASKVAQYLYIRGRYTEAERLFQQALGIWEQLDNHDHPAVVALLTNLANLYRDQGKYTQAESLFQRALRIGEQILGPTHVEVARALSGLARLYWSQGRYVQAEPLFQRAMQIQEQAHGPEHPKVVPPLVNLAGIYVEQGRYAEAETLFRRALVISEQALGVEHPLLAFCLNSLAALYGRQDQYAQAEPLYQRALHLREATLGAEHPLVALSLTNLADSYWGQGQYTKAEPLFQRALQIWEQALGPEHPDVAYALNGLANLRRDQNHYPEAEQLYLRALSIQEQHLGQHHPDTTQTLYELALLRQKQGKLNEALALAERVLDIRLQTLGEAHPRTSDIRMLYEQLLQEPTAGAEKTATRKEGQAVAGACNKAYQADTTSSSQHKRGDVSSSADDPLQGFLDACCELHPRAWCRISDLWQAYERWVDEYHERFPLPRRAFAAHLKAHGCCTDRTSTARIWRGITLRKPEL